VSIHYAGTLSPTPLRVACRAISPQATTTSWHATDCGDCKKKLIGMEIQWKFAEWVTARIAEVVRDRATIVYPRAEDEAPSLFELETRWEVKQ
jgi:hypothetical protein